jgi:hypothetical protein
MKGEINQDGSVLETEYYWSKGCQLSHIIASKTQIEGRI